MDHFQQHISLERPREDFLLSSNRRVFLSTSAENLTSEFSPGNIVEQNSYPHLPCPPKLEKPIRLRPFHGHNRAFADAIVHGTPSVSNLLEGQIQDVEMTDQRTAENNAAKCLCVPESSKSKDFRSQQQTCQLALETSIKAINSEKAEKETATYEFHDAKADKKRKRNEKKERKAKRKETKKEEVDNLKAERIMADLSRNRSIFSGHKDILPSVGKKEVEVNFYFGKLPGIEEPDMFRKPEPDNNVIDVIRRHNTQVRTAAFLRDMGNEYLKARAGIMASHSQNEAVSIIEKHEEQNGKAYHMYKECHTAASFMSKSARKQTHAQSRSSLKEFEQIII